MANYVRGRPATREAPQRASVAYAPPVTPPCLRPGWALGTLRSPGVRAEMITILFHMTVKAGCEDECATIAKEMMA